MTNISAGMVKELRDKTGAGMMDCKAALGETKGDVEGAVDWLRKKGLAKAAKKAGRMAPDVGKIGVLVALESSADSQKLMVLGRQLAMHVAAKSPLALSVDALPPDVVARERAIYADQARQSGKTENVIEKMIEGRLRKYYEESVFLSQIFVIDGETPVAKVLERAAKDLGAPVRLAGFVRFAVGEGIEKATTDFAAEVKATAGA